MNSLCRRRRGLANELARRIILQTSRQAPLVALEGHDGPQNVREVRGYQARAAAEGEGGGVNISVWLDVHSYCLPRNVDAELLPELAPHLAFVATFTVHQSQYCISAGTLWQITNVESGRRIGHFYKTKAKAIADARTILSAKTEESFISAYRKCKPGEP